VLSVVGAKTAATRGVRRQLLKQRLVETLVEHLAFGFELIGKFKPNRHIQSVQHALQHCDELGCVVRVLKLETRPGTKGGLMQMNPFSGTNTWTGSLATREAASTANA
jgi:hypothetical protein